MSIEIRNLVTENLKIDQAPAASGYIPVADATGNLTLTAPANITGIGSANIVTGIAGEALANRDLVTLLKGVWKKSPASGPFYMSPMYGFVNQTSGAALNAAVSVQISGSINGFTGLTASAYVYVTFGSPNGGITNTPPAYNNYSSFGSVSNPVGISTSATQITILQNPVIMSGFASMADGAIATMLHADDPMMIRRLRAYVQTLNSSPETSYASSNLDNNLELGYTGVSVTTSGTDTGSFFYVGNSGGTNYAAAQSFQVSAGTLTQLSIGLTTNVGTPSGSSGTQGGIKSPNGARSGSTRGR